MKRHLGIASFPPLAIALVAGLASTVSERPLHAQGAAGASVERIRALVDSLLPAEIRASGIPGAAIAVVLGDSLVFSRGYGVASVETGEPATADALFRIASTTKMLTAAAVLIVQSRGLLSLDAPIATWARNLHPAVGRLRLRDLLRHRSGLREGGSYYGPHDESALGDFVRQWSDTLLFAASDDVYSYSNLGYTLAGHVLAEATGGSYSDAMAQLLFAPLGMTRSTLLPTRAMTFPLVQGHDIDSLGRPAVVRPYSDDTRFWPAGSVFTSANDYARFVIAVLNEGRIGNTQALPRDAAAALLTRQTGVPDGPPNERAGYTFGLIERWRGQIRLLQHGGARIGFGSIVRFIPERRAGIVLLLNRTGAVALGTLEALTALLVPEAAPPSASVAGADTVRTAQHPSLLGRYVNAPSELALELIDASGVVALRQASGATILVRRLRDGRYIAGGQPFAIVPGDQTRDSYLVIGGHALRKVQ